MKNAQTFSCIRIIWIFPTSLLRLLSQTPFCKLSVLFAVTFSLSITYCVDAQCAGFPPTVDEKDCSQYTPLFNNMTLNLGDTAGFCSPDPSEMVFTGVNLFGGTIRICGNTSLSGNLNSGTIVVQCGSSLRLPSNTTLNNGVKIINYGSVEVNGNLEFQNVNNAFYNENDSSRLIVSGNLRFPQNSGQNAYLKNNGYIEIGGRFDALDGGFYCFSSGAVLQCNDFRHIMNCGGPSNRFSNDGSGGTAIIRYSSQADIRAAMTASPNYDIYQASGSSVNFNGCGSFGSANVVPNAPALIDPGTSNANCPSNCFTILSVELIDFEGFCNAGLVKLNWSTASEENSDYFILERSTDGISFDEVSKIKASGTTTHTTHYEWMDSALEQINYYRLRQFDFDGFSRLFKTISVNACVDEVFVYPNPCEDWLNIHMESKIDQHFAISDCTGQLVSEGDISKEDNRIFTGTLSSGVYYLNIGQQVFKVVKK